MCLISRRFDAIVIGTGQAGPSLAAKFSGAGRSVATIERQKFGGTCGNTGCIPTKTLVASAGACSDFPNECGDSDNYRNFGATDDLVGDREGFGGVELGGFAHDAENGEAGDAAAEVEVSHAVDRGVVHFAIVREGRDCNGVDAAWGVVEEPF